jgi:hypothetical protein
MKIVYRVSQEDYLGTYRMLFANQKPWYRRVSRRLFPWMGGTLLVLEGIAQYLIPHRDLLASAAVSFFGLYFLYCGFAPNLFLRRAYKNNRVFQHDFSADISEDGIHLASVNSETRYKWSGFVRWRESDSVFMLYLSELNFVAFPKRAFAPGEIDQFKELLRFHIAVAS